MKFKLLLLFLGTVTLAVGGTILAIKTTPGSRTVVSTSETSISQPSVLVKVPNIPIERQAIAASKLAEGMTKAEVFKLMGKPSDIKAFSDRNPPIEIINYRQAPMVTKVSMIDGYVSGVTIELKAISHQKIPSFAQNLKPGMTRSQVLKLLGQPLAQKRTNLSTYKLEQLTYVREGELPINIVLRDGLVEGVNSGLENSGKIVKVILPAAPNLSATKRVSQQIRIGMNPLQVLAIFGEPTIVEFSQIQQQPVAHLVYTAPQTNASTQFTFINNVLTRFSFVPQSYLSRS